MRYNREHYPVKNQMNQSTLTRTNPTVMGWLQQLADRPRVINQITLTALLLSLAVWGIDITWTSQTGSILDIAALAGILLLLLAQFTLILSDRKLHYAPQIIYVLSVSLVVLLTINQPVTAGYYFYLFPLAMAYYCVCTLQLSKNGMSHFYLISLIGLAALLVSVWQQHPVSSSTTMHLDWLLRLAAAVLLSGLFLHYIQAIQHLGNSITRVRRNYYEALFQSYQDSFIIYQKQTNEVVECNARFLSMFNIPLHETLQGLNMAQVMMRYLSADSPNMESVMNGLPDNWEGEADFFTHDKKLFHAHIKTVGFIKDDIEYSILTIRDITERKIADKELRQSKNQVEKAARAKARFLSSMSHELRTPLNGIIGTSNLMLTEPFLSDGIKNHINVLKYSSEHMLGIINDILDFSKIDAGKMELKKQPFNVKESMDNIIASFENQFAAKKIELVTDYDPMLDKAFVLSDRVKLGQVISNLLSNALKFTLTGTVTLKVRIQKSSSKKHTILFEVADTGIGIPATKQAEIFQGFTQVHAEDLKRDFGGTGLGLTISERLVNMFGGELKVESELEIGSRFYFTIGLPIADAIVKQEDSAPGMEEADIRGIRVLVVEDNEINAAILKKFLTKWEVNLKEATHGIQALELLRYHKFDLVMMDLEMPEMDGYATIRKIRETDQDLPVVAFTAALLENMEAFITENGFNDYILKPYRPSDLKKKIARYAPHRKVDY